MGSFFGDEFSMEFHFTLFGPYSDQNGNYDKLALEEHRPLFIHILFNVRGSEIFKLGLNLSGDGIGVVFSKLNCIFMFHIPYFFFMTDDVEKQFT